MRSAGFKASCRLLGRTGNSWLVLSTQSSSRCLSLAYSRYMLPSLSQPPYGHVAVKTLVLPLFHEIGLMKNTDRTIRPYGLIEFSPRRQMIVAMSRIVLQMLVGAPILNCGQLSHVPVRSGAQKTKFRVLIQLLQHPSHRTCYRNPFVQSEPIVDSHSDDKDYEGAFHLCRKASRYYFSH